MLPFPNMNASSTEEQVAQIYTYLIQLKEALEFALANISSDNLSQELINRFEALGEDVKNNAEERNDQIQQIANAVPITISDVINSLVFKSAVKNELSNIKFTVNFDTGNLEY